MRVRKDPSAAGPWLYLLLLLVSSCWSDFLSFEPGVEYAYRIQTVSEVSRVNEPFHIGAQVSFQHLNNTRGGQACLLKVHSIIWKHGPNKAIQSEEHDHSKWFSFEISGRGEIAHVWYPPSEVPDVVNTKKGILGFFSARLHHNHEVGKPGEESWTYVTNETGHEGHHMSTYSVEPHASGFKVTKVREGHPAMGTDSESRMEKHMYFNNGKKIPHRVFIREKVSTPRKDQPGFNIHKGTRGGSFVNEQQEFDLPEMSSSAESEFILIGLSEASPAAPPANLKRDVIFITKVSKRFGPAANMTEQKAPIRQDLACLRRLALRNASPSKQVIGCFTHLRDTLGSLSEGDLESVVQHYFNMPDMPTRQLDKQNLINAVASFHTDFSDRLVVENVLLSPRPNKDIIEHVLPNFVGIDQPPSKLLVSTLEDLAFYPDDFDEVYLDPSVRQTCLLVLGSLANVVSAHGDRKTTQRVVGRFEDKLGLHDPWLERQKRSIKTAEELERHDFERVTLLEALGNAAQPSSYEHILSYTNHSLAPPLLRRSGLHALRKYHNQQSADRLQLSALTDEDEHVRYEANLYYQAHPHGQQVDMAHQPIEPGIHNVTSPAVEQCNLPTRLRTKRGLSDRWKGISFLLEAPGVDWKKIIGSSTIGASFGVIVRNRLDLAIAPISGHFEANSHNEIFARAHLGMLGINLDLLVVRMCFRGETSYNLNLLQEFDVDEIKRLVSQFDSVVTKIYSNMEKGINALKDVITGDPDIIGMFEDLIGLIEQLPDKAFKLRNAVENALRTLGQFNSEDWPEPAQPIIQMVMGVIDTYHQIKSDILGFYNAVNMGIKVDLPWAAEQIWGSIITMIEALNDVFSNPKGALSDMFKSAFRLIQAVTKLIERKNEIMGYVYPNGDWPYWFDLSGLATEVMDNITTALEASEAIGQAWVAEITQDPVKHVLGKSESELKRYMMSQLGDVLNSLREPIAPLLTLVSEVQEMFTLVEDTINSVKEGYALLFEMYSKVKAIQERLFGPKAHLKFPRKIRLSGNGCGEDGFYPTDNRGKYEGRMGVDLDADIGNLIVSPFSGNMWKLNDKAVGINCTESSMNGMTAYVENVDLDSTVFKNAEQVSVLAGDEIGKASRSSCSNHIHFSVERDNIFVDISKFLEPRFINLPQWIQHCDDYKLVYKFQTIKAGYIVGLGGQKNEDTSPERTVTEPDTSNLQMPEKTKRKKRGISISVSSNGEDLLTTLGIPAIDSSGPAGGGFSMTKLKICNILDFLQAVGMDDTREALIKVIESVQALIESKPCSRPETKTDDRLRAELELRGSETTGSREQLITRMKQVDQGCPLLTLSLPDNVYCTVDDLCLGVSCCVDLQVWKFRKSIKAYARFDIEEFTFKMGIETAGLDPWTYEYKAADGIWDVEMELDTEISFGFVGVDMDLRLRFVLEYEKPTHFFLTLRVGLCGEECLEFFTLLNHALLPIPEKLPNGTWVWPDIDWESQLQNVVTQSMRHIGQQALAWLGLPADVLDNTEPCPFPRRLTDAQLVSRLQKQGLSTTGDSATLLARYEAADRSCRFGAELPVVPESLSDHIYCSLEDTCLGINCCVEVSIPALDFTKAFRAFVKLDVCEFEIMAGFETLEYRKLIFNYPWGGRQEIKLSEGINILLTIDRDADHLNFIIDLGLKACHDGDCFLEVDIFDDLVLPIPICNVNASLTVPSIDDFVDKLAGEVSQTAVDIILKQLGLQQVFLPVGEVAQLPANSNGSSGCPLFDIDFSGLPDPVQCQLDSNCLGVNCVLSVSLRDYVTLSTLAYVSLDACNYEFSMKLGHWSYEVSLLTYNWGEIRTKEVANNALDITYSIRKDSGAKEFVLDVVIDLCIENTCIRTIPLLQNTRIPQPFCNPDGFALPGGSIDGYLDYLEEQGQSALVTVTDAAVDVLLEKLGLSDVISTDGEPCYRPTVLQNGWAEIDKCNQLKPPQLPDTMACTVIDSCMGVECCLDLDFKLIKLTVTSNVHLDFCSYKLLMSIGNVDFEQTLFTYEWGSLKTFTIGNAIEIDYSINKDDLEKMFVVDFAVSLCLDGDCSEPFPLLKQSRIPQLGCNTNFTLPGGSIHGFMKYLLNDTIENVGQELSEAGINAVLKHLGLDDVLSVKDGQFRAPDDIETVNGWSVPELNQSTSMPSPPDGWVCVVNDNLLGTKCYFSVDLIAVTLRTTLWMDLDMCTYTFSAGIGLKTFSFRLFDYNYGEERTLIAGSVFSLRYTIGLDEETDSFVLDLGVTLCVDSICTDITLWSGFRAPQPGCGENVILGDYTLDEFLAMVADASLGSATRTATEAALKALGLHKVLSIGESCDMPEGLENGWKGAQNCPANLPTLPNTAGCTVHEGCMGMDCCIALDIKITTIVATAFFDFDACNYTLSVGIGNWQYDYSIFTYSWGKEETLEVGEMLTFTFIIDNIQTEDVFQLDFAFRLCFNEEMTDCTEVTLLQGSKVPKTGCATAPDIPGGSIRGWMNLVQEGLVETLGEAAIDYVLQRLGLTDVFAGQACKHERLGWHEVHACPDSLQLPALPSSVNCWSNDLCTGATCCMDIDLVVKSLATHVWLILDPCDYRLSAGVGGRAFQFELFQYNWGEESTLDVGDALHIRYTIGKDPVEKVFVVDFSVQVCIDSDCTEPVPLLNQAGLPQPLCQRNASYQAKWPGGGSFSEFVTTHGNELGTAVADLAFEKWGVSDLLLDSACTLVGQNSANRCELNIAELGLSDDFQFAIHDFCFGIETCVEMDLVVLRKTLKAEVRFDPCNYTLSISLGSRRRVLTLLDVEWGVEQTWQIGTLFQIRHTIWNMAEHQNYRISLDIDICLDEGACSLTHQVLQDLIFPKPFCNFNGTLQFLNGMSTTAFLNSLDPASLAADALESQLIQVFEALEIADLYSTATCTAAVPDEAPSCSWTPDFPDVDIINCRMTESCTGIMCCVDFDFLAVIRSFKVYFDIDFCMYKLVFGIGSRQYEYQLFTLPLAEEQTITIGQAFYIRFIIYQQEMDFRVHFAVSLCIDGRCVTSVDLLSGATINKPLCNMTSIGSYQLPGDDTIDTFAALSKDFGEEGLRFGIEAVFRKLGIADMLSEGRCVDPTPVPITRDCSDNHLPELPGVSCVHSQYCLGIICCVEIDLKITAYSFRTWLTLDPEAFRLSAGIGTREFEYSMFTFPWGVDQEIIIGTVFKLLYNTDDLTAEKAFSLSLSLDVSVGSPVTSLPGLFVRRSAENRVHFPLLVRSVVPKRDFSTDFTLPGNGTIAGFREFLGGLGVDPMDVSAEALFRSLGISELFVSEPCTEVVNTNVPETCSNPNATLPNTHGLLTCGYSEDCSGIECCTILDFKIFTRNFKLWFKVDTNVYSMSFGFGNVTWTPSIFTFPWGLQQSQTIGDVLEIRYAVEKIGYQYKTYLEINLNVEGDYLNIPILNGHMFQEPQLDLSEPVSLPDSSVSFFLSEVGYSAETPMANIIQQAVFRHYDIFDFVDVTCDSAAIKSTVSCPNIPLPESDDAHCAVNEDCSGIHCCVTVDLVVVERSFLVTFKVNPDDFELRFSFADKSFGVNLFGVPWGLQQDISVGNIFELVYKVDSFDFGKQFQVDFSLSSSIDNVRQEVQLLEGVHLTSPTENSVGVGNAELLSIGDILAAIKELPMTLQKEEILPFVASEIGMEVDDLRLPDEWLEKLDAAPVPDCPLADVSRNTSALTNGMVECIPLSYCQGIKCHVIFDLKVVQPKIQLSFELMPCFPGFGLRLRLENVEKNIMFGSKYDVREGPTEYESFGEVLKLRYRVLLTDDQQFRSTFSLLVCVNRICFVNVDLVTDIVIPRPSSCGRRRRGVKITGAGLSFLQDNNFEQRQVGAIFHGDVQFCQEKLRSHHTGQVCPGLKQKEDPNTICVPHGNCLRMSCCIHLMLSNEQLATNISVDLDTCGRYLTITVGYWKINETIPKGHNVSLKKEQVSDSVDILYSVVNPDDHRVVISLTLKVCDGETTNETCKNIKVLKEVVVPLFGCRLDKTEAVSATASYHRYKRSVPISSVGQTQINLHRERYTSQATYNRQKQLIKQRLDRRNAVVKVVKREPSTCAANEFWDNTIGEVRDMLDLHAVDPVIAFQLIKDLQELYAQLVEEAIDLLLSKSEEDIFSSFDIKLRGTFSFPRRTVNFFSYETFFLIGGMVPATFGFGANGYYGADLSVVASLMNMNVQGGITPYLGVQVYGELGVGALLYAKLRLEGDIMETRFPITAEIRFSKFPMDVGMTLDIELIPLQLKLKALVTLEVKIPFIGTIKKTLFKKTLWKYTTSSIKSRILDLHTWEPDNSAPELETVGGGGAAGRKRRDNDYLPHQTRECMVKQLKGLDYTEPAIQIEITANDDRSKVPLTYSVGTVPNSDDVVSKEELGGPTTVLKRDLTFGVPLYFTAEACNNAGLCSQATCSMSTYDNTLPGGRIDAAFLSSSNQYKLSAVAKLFDDSEISQMRESVGFGKGTWSDQIHPWSEFQLTKNSATSGGDPLSSFTPEVLGRLTAESFEEIKGATVDGPNPGKCALQCLRYPGTKCMSFNFDFESKDCQLLSAIEAVGQKQGSRRERSGFYHYYERLGVGHTAKFEHAGLSLQHNHLYFFNVEVVNTLGYTGTLASEGVVADFTPPEPGYVGTGKSDYVTLDSCQNMLIDNWDRRCVDHTDIPNHRIIYDGPESETVFNGIEPNIGVYHTRANTYIAANWKGIRDDETGIYGYSWSIGESPGKDLIHPHIDPHAHLYNEAEWTHSGNIHPIPADKFPNSILPDGKYYITVRGVNKVEYGGPMVLSVSHTSPYIIDNTPPDVHAITSVKYNEETSQIFVAYNMSDVESDIREADLGFGKTKYDVLLKSWVRHLYTGNETHVGNFTMEVALEDGVPAWAKIRGINKVNLRAVGVADSPIVVDRTRPIAGEVYDGDQVGEDLQFINKAEEVCANWKDFYDEDSGIKDFMWGVGSTPGELDILEYVKVSSSEHVWCSNIDTELQHNLTYYSTIVATHNGHRGLNVSGISNGVVIDLTPPEAGWVVDGNYMDMDPSTGLPMDEVFTSEPAMVSAQWGEFVDPESDIDSYSVSVWRSAPISDGAWGAAEEIHEPDKLDKEKTQVEYFHFQLSHGDRIYTAITARNGATDTTEGRSNGVIVDLTAPDLQYLVDTQANENDTIEDSDYQTNENSISSSWEFEDQESGIDHYKIAIIETMHGTKQQIYPVDETWKLLYPPGLSHHTQENLILTAGAQYHTRVAAANRAKLSAPYDTDGITVDPSAPTMLYVLVGVLDGSAEEKIDGYVWQADPEGIQASWLAVDGESGIQDYWVSVGTSPGGSEILENTNLGMEQSGYIHPLTLLLTDEETCDSFNTCSPVYYLSVKARNGAGSFSQAVTSSPIRVVDRDKTGYVTDGTDPTSDADYQMDTAAITAHFSGFQSQLHGIAHYLWAVGTSSGSYDVQSFVSAGIVLTAEDEIKGGGLGESGMAKAVLTLSCGQTYYIIIRALTGYGNILESVSNGITVDCTPPMIDITSFGFEEDGDNTELLPGETRYQYTKDTLSAAWEFTDGESPGVGGNIMFGTFPFGKDIQQAAYFSATAVSNMKIRPLAEGVPNILSIEILNGAGLWGSVYSGGVIIDQTPPHVGTVVCPKYISVVSEIECNWGLFLEDESNIVSYDFMVGTRQNLDDIFQAVTLDRYRTKFRATGLVLQYDKAYYVSIKATNSLRKTTYAYSDAIIIDDTPPLAGLVVEVSDMNTFNFSIDGLGLPITSQCNSATECEILDAMCQRSLTSVSAAWEPFTDTESPIIRYEVAIGTTPGGGQLRPFSEVSNGCSVTITGLDLADIRQVYVSVRGTNAAGLATVAVSNGVYISRVSSGLTPLPAPHVRDGHLAEDLDYQTSLNELQASWDFSEDPCPIVQYEWSIKRVDETVIQPFTDIQGNTHSSTDGLQMKSGETYYITVRATNALGKVQIQRSDGITIEAEALVPGVVFGGPITGFHIPYQVSTTEISANWNYFGTERNNLEGKATGNEEVKTDEKQHQAVAYYEVAVGTDRTYPNTRDNIVEFTNAGLNKTWTFHYLNLEQSGFYYITVRAYSTSNAMVEVTSNGIQVGFEVGVTAGEVFIPEFARSSTTLTVEWAGFESTLDMYIYYMGISHAPLPVGTQCADLIDDESEVHAMFGLLPISLMEKDTFYIAHELSMDHNNTYYVTVVGVDEAGECNMTTSSFLVDLTNPVEGQVRVGPLYEQELAYVVTKESITVHWEGYHDPESDLSDFELVLYSAKSCAVSDENVLSEISHVTVNSSYPSYTFLGLTLQENTPYFVELAAFNKAGRRTSTRSVPVIYDVQEITAGDVHTGLDFLQDVTFIGSTTKVEGSVLHLADPSNDNKGCPHTPSLFTDVEWSTVKTTSFWGLAEDWDIVFRPKQVVPSEDGRGVAITMERDVQSPQIFSGAIYRNADIQKGGTYKVDIRTGASDFSAITAVVFWDGPDGTVGDFDVCLYCCQNTNDQFYLYMCPCDCSIHLVLPTDAPDNVTVTVETYTEEVPSEIQQDVPKYVVFEDKVEGETYQGHEDEMYTTQSACGMQIHTNGVLDSKIVLWCRYYDNKYPAKYETMESLNFDPSEDWHTYQFIFKSTSREGLEHWSLELLIDSQTKAVVAGLPSFSDGTKLIFDLWNGGNTVPELELQFKPPTTTALFRNVVLPPTSDVPCRHGRPFQGNKASILRYSAGLFTDDGSMVLPFQTVAEPCMPCLDTCSHFACDLDCERSEVVLYPFTLSGLELSATTNESVNGTVEVNPIAYVLRVRALSSNGLSVTSRSSGFYIDVTAPVMDIIFHIDVKQGELEPVNFQQSNSTIKAFFNFIDNESGVKEYWWAIGASVGSTEIQNFTYVGLNQSASNSRLEGTLQSNLTYYVTVKAINNVGLFGIGTSGGVQCLFNPPDMTDVNTTVPGAKGFDVETSQADAKQSNNPKVTGGTFSKPSDPSVSRIEYCLSSREDLTDDIFPCTVVGTNSSGSVEVKDGEGLLVSGEVVANLTDIKPPNVCSVSTSTSSGSSTRSSRSMTSFVNSKTSDLSSSSRCSDSAGSNSSTSSVSRFNMPPGSCMHPTIQMCNEAGSCGAKKLNTITIITDEDKAVASVAGQKLSFGKTSLNSTLSERRKKRSIEDDFDVKVESSTVLPPGTTISFGMLDEERETAGYASDSSDGFIPFITEPALTTQADMTARILRKRIKSVMRPSFYLAPLAQKELNCSLVVTVTFDAAANWTDDMPLLIFWNKDYQEWDDASRTCVEEGSVDTNYTNGTMVTHICTTSLPTDRSRRSRRDADMVSGMTYMSRETQFAVAVVSKTIPNEPPQLLSDLSITMNEDSGTLMYWLEAEDIDNDDLVFGIVPDSSPKLGTMSLSSQGLLQYRPLLDHFGIDEIIIYVRESRENDDIIPILETRDTVNITIKPKSDNPFVYVEMDGEMLIVLENNTVEITVEQNIGTNIRYQDFDTTVAVWDPDSHDTLTIDEYIPTFGNIWVNLLEPNDTDLPTEGTYIQASVKFVPIDDYYGHDEFILMGRDADGLLSERLIFKVYILHMPCINNGTCTGIREDTNCTATSRADGYDGYECSCPPGWVGRYCETDQDECLSSPCPWPQDCVNFIGGFSCECLPSKSACSGLTPWQYAVIFLSLAALGVIGLLVYRFRLRNLKWVHRRQASVGTYRDEAFVQSTSHEMTTPSDNDCVTLMKTEPYVPAGIVGPCDDDIEEIGGATRPWGDVEDIDETLPGATCPSP